MSYVIVTPLDIEPNSAPEDWRYLDEQFKKTPFLQQAAEYKDAKTAGEIAAMTPTDPGYQPAWAVEKGVCEQCEQWRSNR